MFSILIPTWNNREHLKLCIQSIEKNSKWEHEILIHVNEGADGTLEWVKDSLYNFTHSEKNIGICEAVNLLAGKATRTYIVYMNDDMYACPDWDYYLMQEILSIKTKCFLFSATMIEPRNTNNPCVVVKDFGRSIEDFREEELLREFNNDQIQDWSGATWPPTIVHRDFWNVVGGYSIEFSPGMSSDDDFSKKMWEVGCRIFKGVAKSKVYHFQCKSTGRITKNNGRKQFLMKWGMNQSTFNRYFLKRGENWQGLLEKPSKNIIRKELWRAKWKKILWS